MNIDVFLSLCINTVFIYLSSHVPKKSSMPQERFGCCPNLPINAPAIIVLLCADEVFYQARNLS